jgi:hypothetical protein
MVLKFLDKDPGSGMETVLIRDPGWRQFGSGIRDGKKSDPGSGINIPDLQHWLWTTTLHIAVLRIRIRRICTVYFWASWIRIRIR